jgi:hypothetical protein
MRHRVHRHLSFFGCATLSLALTLSAAGMVGIGESGERRVHPAQVGVPRDVYLYDARNRTARRLAA